MRGTLQPFHETVVIADKRKAQETTCGSEESEVDVNEGAKKGIRHGKTDERGEEGQSELEGTTTMKREEADMEIGSTAGEARNTKNALQSVEGEETSMHPKEWQ